MPAPGSYTTDDLEFFFYGGGSDAEYAFLASCYAAGITAQDIVGYVAAPPGSTTDHGSMLGLGDDDHPQYHNNARGDARYDARYLPIGTAYESTAGAQAKADAKVENQIIDGVTTKAPSQEAVYEALLTKAAVVNLNLKADIASPALTGNPTAPTQTPGTNNTRIATTAYADAADLVLKGAPPGTLDTLAKLATAINNDPAFYTTLTALLNAKVGDAIADNVTTVAPSQNAVFDALALKAPVASPALTGTPTVPDEAYGPAWAGAFSIPTKNALRNKLETFPTDAFGLIGARPAAAGYNNGSTYWATDVAGGTLYQVQSGVWVQVARGLTETVPTATLAAAAQIPHTDIVHVNGAAGTTSSTAPVDMPVPLAVTNFVKARADTDLFIRIHGGWWIDDAVAQGHIYIDIGGADYQIVSLTSSVASSPFQVSGEIKRSGIGAGTIASIKAQWRVPNATTVLTQVGLWTLSVTETF